MQNISIPSKHSQLTHGFTLVELLIVIVVIAILAAITIIAYNGVQQRAVVASIVSDLDNANKVLLNDETLTGSFPVSVAAANNGQGLSASPGNTYQYSYDNTDTPQTYCLTATNGTTSYYMVPGGTPTAGACPGQMNGGVAVITNYSLNPGIETNTTGFSGTNSSVVSRDTTFEYSGAASAKVVMPANGSAGNVGTSIYNPNPGVNVVPNTLAANTTYQISAWVYTTATMGLQLSVQGTGYSSKASPTPFTGVHGSWTRLSSYFTTNSSGTLTAYILNSGATTAGTTFWVDDVMVTATNSLTNYADGSSTNWTWNGTANNSTSYGPTP